MPRRRKGTNLLGLFAVQFGEPVEGDSVAGQPGGHGEVGVACRQLGQYLSIDGILGFFAQVLTGQRHVELLRGFEPALVNCIRV